MDKIYRQNNLFILFEKTIFLINTGIYSAIMYTFMVYIVIWIKKYIYVEQFLSLSELSKCKSCYFLKITNKVTLIVFTFCDAYTFVLIS